MISKGLITALIDLELVHELLSLNVIEYKPDAAVVT